MKKSFLILLFLLLPFKAFSAGGNVHLDHVDLDLEDKASLQRGVGLYTNYCMGCHSLEYARYGLIARDLDIPEELYVENLIFDSSKKAGDLITISMPVEGAQKWFGAPPPDLTLIARKRGADWVYTYLRSFYEDPSRPWGVNNVVFPSVGMPHVLHDLQGDVVKVKKPCEHGEDVDPLSGAVRTDKMCDAFEHVEGTGSMTPAEFDQAMYDLTNFLVYIAEPIQVKRKQIGFYVLGFLVILFVFVYLLNREYWKDIH